jgi:glutaredoxin 3
MTTQTARVVMYATGWCTYCARARALFQRKNISFEEIDIDRDPALREQMIARDDLHALDAQGGLDPLLVSQEAQNHG